MSLNNVNELIVYFSSYSSEKIPDYTKRLQDLKTITNYIDSPPPPNRLRSTRIRRGASEAGDDALKEMNQLQSSKQYADLRKELLQDDSLRRRKPLQEGASGEQSEAVKYIRENQEMITEHMLSLTRNLREQTETANRIIKKDTEMVSRSAGMADRS